jgi:hypothetical protein
LKLYFIKKKEKKKPRENGNGLHFNQSQQTRTTLDCPGNQKHTSEDNG